MAKKQVPIIEGLFTWPSQKPQLLASKCKKCGSYFFPKVAYCGNPDCPKDKANMEVVPLSNTGEMYTFTIHTAQPAVPFRMEPFKPYGVAMVDVLAVIPAAPPCGTLRLRAPDAPASAAASRR